MSKNFMEDVIADVLKRNLILDPGVDADTPIYRILKLQYLLKDICDQRLTLARVMSWEDTHEAAYFKRPTLFGPKKEPTALYGLALHWFGQSWSTIAESAAMWDVYDHHDKDHPKPLEERGVQIQSTPRQLLEGIVRSLGTAHPEMLGAMSIMLYVGSASYLDETKYTEQMATDVESHLSSDGVGLAKMLCMKRYAFDYEREVRLLYQSDTGPSVSGQAVIAKYFDTKSKAPVDYGVTSELLTRLRLPYDWGGLNAIKLGPRVTDDTVRQIEAVVRSSVTGIKVSRSELYGKPSFPMPPFSPPPVAGPPSV